MVLLANQAQKLEYVLVHNARSAIFSLNLPQLKLIGKDQGIQSKGTTLRPTLTDLIRVI